MIESHPPALMSELLQLGSKFRVEPHPGTIEGRQATRYWLTEVSDASRDLETNPFRTTSSPYSVSVKTLSV